MYEHCSKFAWGYLYYLICASNTYALHGNAVDLVHRMRIKSTPSVKVAVLQCSSVYSIHPCGSGANHVLALLA